MAPFELLSGLTGATIPAPGKQGFALGLRTTRERPSGVLTWFLLSGTRPTPVEGTPARVLVVEDDQNVRQTLDSALRFAGHEVVTVDDGDEALDEISAREPDLIVLDVMMPRLDGLTVCRMLRDRGYRTPVLVLTARHEVSDRVAGLDAGADDYLAKPFALTSCWPASGPSCGGPAPVAAPPSSGWAIWCSIPNGGRPDAATGRSS